MQFNQDSETIRALAGRVELLLLDVDGVLTDGRLYFSNSGEEMKAFSTLDGHGVKMLQKSGVRVGIITGRQSRLVQLRAAEMGVDLVLQGREDKLDAFNEVLTETGLQHAQVAYAGDDFPDLPVLLAAGLSFSVAGGHHDVRSRVHAVTDSHGGRGAVREITDFLLQAKGLYENLIPGSLE
ncbi:MAG: HAD hydrolase family protein [Pseudohongiellaceae bacterium]